MLPDRDLVLEVVDQLAAGLDGLAAVGAGDGDDDRDVTDPEVADAVHGGQRADRVVGDDLLGDAAQLGLGGGVTGVAEAVDVRPSQAST